MNRAFIFLFALVIYSNLSNSQVFTTYNAVNTGTNQLLSNSICDIKIRQDGAIVFGNDLGLSILCNEQWTNVEIYGADCFDIDSEDNIWVGTHSGKAIKYNGISTFETQLTSQTNCDGPCPVFSCLVDKTGNIWFGTGEEGVYMFNGFEWISYPNLEGLSVFSISQDINDNIWFGTGNGITKFDGINWITYTESDGLTDNYIKTIFCEPDGDIWAGTNNGISVFNGVEWSNINKDNGLLDDRVNCISKDIEGRIWAVTDSGISIFNGSEWNYITSLDSLVFSYVTSIIHDSNEILWIGTDRQGVYKYNEISLINIMRGDGLSTDCVKGICIDNSGTIWVACYSGWPSSFNGLEWITYQTNDAPYWVQVVTYDETTGNYWYGTDGSIVAEFNGIDWTRHDLDLYTGSCIGINSLYVNNTGILWVGTWLGGVCKFDGSDWVNYTIDDGLADNDVFSINQDTEGRMLFGTRDGLTIYNGTNWTTYTKVNGLASNRVNDILVESDTVIWLATDEGLSKFNGSSFNNFYQSDGLFNNSVKTLAKDKNGNLWIGCNEFYQNGGITRFNGTSWISLSVEDGLASGGVNDLAIDDSSYIWIATDKGISVLNPNTITKNIENVNQVTDNYLIFPNPTTNKLNIQTTKLAEINTYYQIYTSTGKAISKICMFNKNNAHIDLSAFSKGLYIIAIYNKNGTKAYKVVKY